MDFFDKSLISEGGPIMWPLLVLSLIGFLLFVERTFYLHKGQIKTEAYLLGIKNLLKKRRLTEALTVCEETPGPVPKIIKAALLNYDQTEERMRGAIQSAALVEIPNLERRIGSVGAIARLAPLLGLLGTVLGLLSAFDELESAGAYATQGLIAGGIRAALITTATGLTLAAIAYAAHHFLLGRVRTLVNDMEWVANDLIEFLCRDLPEIIDAPEESMPSAQSEDAKTIPVAPREVATK